MRYNTDSMGYHAFMCLAEDMSRQMIRGDVGRPGHYSLLLTQLKLSSPLWPSPLQPRDPPGRLTGISLPQTPTMVKQCLLLFPDFVTAKSILE